MIGISGLRLILVALTIVGAAASIRFTVRPALLPVSLSTVALSAQPEEQVVTPANPESLARAIASHDPFRVDRRPTTVPFDPSRAEGAPPVPAKPPRPSLFVTGVVLGVAPAALIEGLPGSTGSRLVAVGERVGEYRLREVRRDYAVIVGPDSTWTIGVKGHVQ